MTLTQAWESFQEGDFNPAGVREEVLLSWRRSQWSGVNPDAPKLDETPVRSESSFAQVALPLTDHMAQLLTDSNAALTVYDQRGVILGRWVSDPVLEDALDQEQFASASAGSRRPSARAAREQRQKPEPRRQ